MRNVTLLIISLLLAGCGVNPVTGKKEVQLISTKDEVAMGLQYYAPSRQAQGGDLITDPALSAYVQGVGAKLAAVSDRRLPYDFVVLASGVPNAWALPGGKIAVNRGLLLELEDEAELAAVLGHEITHAAARHGAQAQERAMVAQLGIVVTAVALGEDENKNAILGAAVLGTALISTKYGRDAELQSDRYGIRYMAKAGYDPQGAVSLQQKFVALSKGRKPNWLEGMFASHPPSEERVAANQRIAANLPAGGAREREAYQKATAGIRKTKDAYALYDSGRAALAKGDAKAALAAAQKAIVAEPREALFYSLAGAAEAKAGNAKAARAAYDAAIERNPAYFAFWLERGLLRKAAGDAAGAKGDLEKAHEMLPTKASAEALGLPTGQ
jgi:predicted Zn-dependent protease